MRWRRLALLGVATVACADVAQARGAPRLAALPVATEEPPRLAAAAVADWQPDAAQADAAQVSAGNAPATLEGSAGHDALGHRHSAYSGNYLVVAAGVASLPEFDGARRRSLTPAAGIMGRVGPVSFSPRPAGIAFNLLPNHGQRWVLSAGPVFRYQSDRHGKPADPVIAALGTLPATFEAGINASIAYHGLITRADALSLGVDVRWDATGNGAGRIIGASLGYYTPVSRGVLLAGSVFADFVDGDYARFHFGITPAGSLASGLPVYIPHGGTKDVGAQGVMVIDLDGDLLAGGPSLLTGISWNRLQGPAARSPIVRLRGQASQLTYGGGLAYTF
ncbi:MAG: MipA/OmpV family protein [Sphingomonadales bacterium]|nr:MipA/OmpV family protein [Sphingomonadales bacterium]